MKKGYEIIADRW